MFRVLCMYKVIKLDILTLFQWIDISLHFSNSLVAVANRIIWLITAIRIHMTQKDITAASNLHGCVVSKLKCHSTESYIMNLYLQLAPTS